MICRLLAAIWDENHLFIGPEGRLEGLGTRVAAMLEGIGAPVVIGLTVDW
jgi:hypothetical protein